MLITSCSKPLPYQLTALEPYISSQTMDKHYNNHYLGYVRNLEKLVPGSKNEDIIQIIKDSAKIKEQFLSQGNSEVSSKVICEPEYFKAVLVYNNACQIFNHDQFWACLSVGSILPHDFEEIINRQFGSFEKFLAEIVQSGLDLFGSGWIWLLSDRNGQLKIKTTSNANNPDVDFSLQILSCIDIWEHAYYLDYQSDRKTYISNMVNYLWNWGYINLEYQKFVLNDTQISR